MYIHILEYRAFGRPVIARIYILPTLSAFFGVSSSWNISSFWLLRKRQSGKKCFTEFAELAIKQCSGTNSSSGFWVSQSVTFHWVCVQWEKLYSYTALQLFNYSSIFLYGGCSMSLHLHIASACTWNPNYKILSPLFSHNIKGNNNRWALFWKSVIDRTDLIQFRHDDFPSNLDQTVIFLIQLNRFRYGRVYVIGSDRVQGIGRHLNIYESIMELSRINT